MALIEALAETNDSHRKPAHPVLHRGPSTFALTVETAEIAFKDLDATWGARHPAVADTWPRAWAHDPSASTALERHAVTATVGSETCTEPVSAA